MAHSEFHKAVKVENVEKISQLIQEKEIDLDHFDNHGYTALHNAVMNQNEDMVKVLLELPEDATTQKAANCNLQDKAQNGWTPLTHAISNIPANSNHQILYQLVSHGADTNAIGKDGLAPIHWAIELDQTSTIDFLLIHKANIELRAPMGDTPLILAARSDQLDCFEFLVNRSANLLAYNDDRENPLHVAIDEKNTQIVSFLLEYLRDGSKIDPSQITSLINSTDSNGNTPAHVAALRSSFTVADVLYKMDGFDQSIKNDEGFTVPELKKEIQKQRAEAAKRQLEEKEHQREVARQRKKETKEAEQESWKAEEDKYQKERQRAMERGTEKVDPEEKSSNGLVIVGILVVVFTALYGFLTFVTKKDERVIYQGRKKQKKKQQQRIPKLDFLGF